jgi:hypothetical protein
LRIDGRLAGLVGVSNLCMREKDDEWG